MNRGKVFEDQINCFDVLVKSKSNSIDDKLECVFAELLKEVDKDQEEKHIEQLERRIEVLENVLLELTLQNRENNKIDFQDLFYSMKKAGFKFEE